MYSSPTDNNAPQPTNRDYFRFYNGIVFGDISDKEGWGGLETGLMKPKPVTPEPLNAIAGAGTRKPAALNTTES